MVNVARPTIDKRRNRVDSFVWFVFWVLFEGNAIVVMNQTQQSKLGKQTDHIPEAIELFPTLSDQNSATKNRDE